MSRPRKWPAGQYRSPRLAGSARRRAGAVVDSMDVWSEKVLGTRARLGHAISNSTACGLEDPDTRSDTSLIADLDEKLSVLHYDRVEVTAESLSARHQQGLGPATPTVS